MLKIGSSRKQERHDGSKSWEVGRLGKNAYLKRPSQDFDWSSTSMGHVLSLKSRLLRIWRKSLECKQDERIADTMLSIIGALAIRSPITA